MLLFWIFATTVFATVSAEDPHAVYPETLHVAPLQNEIEKTGQISETNAPTQAAAKPLVSLPAKLPNSMDDMSHNDRNADIGKPAPLTSASNLRQKLSKTVDDKVSPNPQTIQMHKIKSFDSHKLQKTTDDEVNLPSKIPTLVKLPKKLNVSPTASNSLKLPKTVEDNSSKISSSLKLPKTTEGRIANDVNVPLKVSNLKSPKTVEGRISTDLNAPSKSSNLMTSPKIAETKMVTDANSSKLPNSIKVQKNPETKAATNVDLPSLKIKPGQLPKLNPSAERHAPESHQPTGKFSSKFQKPSIDTAYPKRHSEPEVIPASRKGAGSVAFPNFKKPSFDQRRGSDSHPALLPKPSVVVRPSQRLDGVDMQNSRRRRVPVDTFQNESLSSNKLVSIRIPKLGRSQ